MNQDTLRNSEEMRRNAFLTAQFLEDKYEKFVFTHNKTDYEYTVENFVLELPVDRNLGYYAKEFNVNQMRRFLRITCYPHVPLMEMYITSSYYHDNDTKILFTFVKRKFHLLDSMDEIYINQLADVYAKSGQVPDLPVTESLTCARLVCKINIILNKPTEALATAYLSRYTWVVSEMFQTLDLSSIHIEKLISLLKGHIDDIEKIVKSLEKYH
jgi:hypothetical protein